MGNSCLTSLAPLYKLLQKGVKWEWKQEQVTALARVRDALQSPNLLTHYDPNQLLVLACDASPFGLCHIGLVMEQRNQPCLCLGLWLQLKGSIHSWIRKRWP